MLSRTSAGYLAIRYVVRVALVPQHVADGKFQNEKETQMNSWRWLWLVATAILLSCSTTLLADPSETVSDDAQLSNLGGVRLAQALPGATHALLATGNTGMLDYARESLVGNNWVDAIYGYADVLMQSTDDSVIARECLEGLQLSFRGLLRNQPPATLLDDSFTGKIQANGVAGGWTLYSNPPPSYDGSPIAPHVIHDGKLIANQSFTGVDFKTRVPLAWESWGTKINHIPDAKDDMHYTGEVRIADGSSGIFQRVSGLIQGKAYKFACWGADGLLSIGIDPDGGNDPKAGSVVWSSIPSDFTDNVDDGRWRRYKVTAKAVQDTATIFIKSATPTGATAKWPSLDCYIGESGGTYPKFYQEFDASGVTGTGSLKVSSYYTAGICRQFKAGSGAALIAKVRGFLNGPDGPMNSYYRIGIDPFGGTNAESDDVVWSESCWNAGVGFGRWADVFVSCRKQSDTATVFVEYDIRRIGFNGTNWMSLLLQNVWVGSTDETAAIAGLINGVARSFEDSYFAFAVESILSQKQFLDGATDSKRICAELRMAEALQKAELGERAKNKFKSVDDSNTPELTKKKVKLAKVLADDTADHGSGLDKHNARQYLKQAINEFPADAESAPARLYLAFWEGRNGHPGKALRLIQDLSDEHMTPKERVQKRMISADAFWSWKEMEKADQQFAEAAAIAATCGDDVNRAQADLFRFQFALNNKPVNKEKIQAIIDDLLQISNPTTEQKARIDLVKWYSEYCLNGDRNYAAAASAVADIAAATEHDGWEPVITFYAFDNYYKSGQLVKAKEMLMKLLQDFPDAQFSSLASKQAYKWGLLGAEGGQN